MQKLVRREILNRLQKEKRKGERRTQRNKNQPQKERLQNTEHKSGT
jgi:hypothetical protein